MRTISSDFTVPVQVLMVIPLIFLLFIPFRDIARENIWFAVLFTTWALLSAAIAFRLARVNFDGSVFYFSAYFVERRIGAELLESVDVIIGKSKVVRLKFRSRIYLSRVIYFVPVDREVDKELTLYVR
jgi:hypothetical protein